MSVLMTGRGGLGDAIYARPFVREAVRLHGRTWIETSWPWMFVDLPMVHVKKRVGGLAVQGWHGDRNPASVWSEPPTGIATISLRYRWEWLWKWSVLRDMEVVSGLRPIMKLDLPPLPRSPLSGTYAVVRAPSVRMDYPTPTREPDPAYLVAAAEAIRKMPVASLGHYVPGLEEPSATIRADYRFENGELSLPEACALVAGAALVVSPPCWLVPFCLAARVPLVVISGGCGGRNHKGALVDSRTDTGLTRWLLPDRYCMCKTRKHKCPKEITDFDGKLSLSMASLLSEVAA